MFIYVHKIHVLKNEHALEIHGFGKNRFMIQKKSVTETGSRLGKKGSCLGTK
jgi:hypothetical protein